ncbi:MAG: alpha/beta hydrolase-fold protein [Candidatus Limnocylindrales bacterium]
MTVSPEHWLTYEEVHGRNHTVTGTVVVWPKLDTDLPGGPREILAYLPPSLAKAFDSKTPVVAATDKRYPVIYFHDGQNMFDEKTSYVGKWCADETLEQFATEGIEAIAIGIPNGGTARIDEYAPWRTDRFPTKTGKFAGGKGDDYVEWLVSVIKPLVDRSFPTRTDREGTGTMGSSLGGLISLHALTKHPDVFGMIGALSSSVFWNDYEILKLLAKLDGPRARVYVDMGGREWRGGFDDSRRIRDTLVDAGWVEGTDLMYVEERHAIHRENAWARRLPGALRFLLRDVAPTAEIADISHSEAGTSTSA